MMTRISAAKPIGARRWLDLPERGTPASLRISGWIALHIGRWAAGLLLYPIAVYFLITAHAARRASYDYLRRVWGRSTHWWHSLRHFYCFAETILDRVYLLRGNFEQFALTLHDREILHRQIDSGKGCILLGAHLGSFEILRTIGVTQQHFPLKVLMDTAHNENISRFLDALNPTIAETVIAPDRPDTLLRVKESLEAGFVIGMLGDRIAGADKTTRCQFLGAPATFPAGPILLAGIMHCPIILFFGLYRSGNRYEIFFEKFADEITLPRGQRAEEIQRWTQRYVDRLEHYARLAPYNWFNFYPFWDPPPPRLRRASDRRGLHSIDREEIRALIPHSGSMCLLESVIEWDERSIVCTSNTHRDPANPLRRAGTLSGVHALEYGAQAAAVHGGLRARVAGATAAPGYVAAFRAARLHVNRLDDIQCLLQVHATRLFGEEANTVYECRVSAGDRVLAEARVTIMPRRAATE
jgi:predicted LPLAT superfamily acyltransferase/predicted hotdog family 3-hydroxylacyl-ACP dehydratase